MFGRICKYWLPLLLWMCVIFGASTSLGTPDHTSRFIMPFLRWLMPHASADTLEGFHHFIRKMAHFTEYSILGMLAWRVARHDHFSRCAPRRQFCYALIFCALYASSDEFHQRYVPGRQPAVTDVMIATCGAACGLAVMWCVSRAFSRIPAKKP